MQVAILACFVLAAHAFEFPFDITAYDEKLDSQRIQFQVGAKIAKAYLRADEENLYVAMAAQGSFVAFGMNDNHGQMEGSDIVACADVNGELAVTDYHATGESAPIADEKQDWVKLQAGRQDGITYCEISRPLEVPCDSHNLDVFVPNAFVACLMSWGPDDNTALHYHGQNRGSAFKQFKTADSPGTPDPSEITQTVTIEAPRMAVPNLPGLETCSFHLLPIDPTKEYHITKVTSSWEKDDGETETAFARGMAHHITLIAFDHIPDEYVDGELIPEVAGAPHALDNCGAMWGRSNGDLVGQVVDIQADEGVYMGVGRAIAVIFLRHFYNDAANPAHASGAPDVGTKFTLEYTEQLRPKTRGAFTLQSTKFSIPPKTTDYVLRLLAPKEVLSPHGATTLTSVSVHMHDRDSDATKVYVRHIRDGKELKMIYSDEDFIEKTSDEGHFPIKVTVEPGDELLLECHYDNPTDRAVIWGSGINNQMCVVTFKVISSGYSGPRQCLYNSDEEGGYVAMCDGTAGFKQQNFDEAANQAKLAYTPYSGKGDCTDSPDDTDSTGSTGSESDGNDSSTGSVPDGDNDSSTGSESDGNDSSTGSVPDGGNDSSTDSVSDGNSNTDGNLSGSQVASPAWPVFVLQVAAVAMYLTRL